MASSPNSLNNDDYDDDIDIFDRPGFFDNDEDNDHVHVDKSEDDDDDYGDGLHEMTKEEKEEYYRVYAQSEGFDVPYFPDVFVLGIIIPMNEQLISSQSERLQLLTQEAIKHYNTQKGTNFEFVNIVKANHQASRGLLYYITFNVRPVGASPESSTITFQARVLSGIPPQDIVVQLCRPQPEPSI